MISQRLRGMSEDGEAIEGLIPKIQAAFDKYTKGAVSVIDKQNGGLHSTYKILEQLSKVYPTLSQEARAYLNEAIAGNRQNKVLVSIMENWDNVEKSIVTATNSLGSAERENQKYLNSIQGKISILQSSVQKLWAGTIDSKTIKFFVDTGTSIVKLTDSFGLLNTVIVITTVSLVLFNKSFQGFLTAKITPVIAGIIASMRGLSGVASASSIAIGGLTFSVQALTSAITMGLALAIPLIINGLKWLSEAEERQRESLRKLQEEYDELSQSLENHESKYQSVIDRLQELYDLRNNNKITETEKEELLRLEKVNIELERQIRYEEALKKIKGKQLEYDALESSGKPTETSSSRFDGTRRHGIRKVTVSEKIDEDVQSLQKYTKALENLQEAYDNNEISAEKYGKELSKLKDLQSKYIVNLNELVKKLEEENKAYNDNTEEGTARRTQNEQQIQLVKDLIISISGLGVALLTLPIKPVTDSFIDLTEAIEDSTKAVEDYNKAIDTMQSNVGDITNVIDQMNKGNSLTGTEIVDLIQKYPGLVNQLEKTETGYKINVAALEELRIAQITEMEIAQQAAINKKVAILDSISAIVEGYGIQIRAIGSLAEAEAQLAGSSIGLYGLDINQLGNGMYKGKSLTDYWGISEAGVKTLETKATIAKTTLEIGRLKDEAKALKDITSNPNFFSGFLKDKNSSSSSSEKEKEKYKATIDAYHQISIELERINQLLSENQALSDLAEGSDKIALLTKRVELLRQMEEAQIRYNEVQKQELSIVQSQIQGMGFKINSDGDITNYAEVLKTKIGDSAKEAEELIKRFVELSTKAIPNTEIEILKLHSAMRALGEEFAKAFTYETEQYVDGLNNSLRILSDTFNDQKEKVRVYSEIIRTLNDTLRSMDIEISNLRSELNSLDPTVDSNTSKILALQSAIDALQSKRINIIVDINTQTQNINQVVDGLFNDIQNQMFKSIENQISSIQDMSKNTQSAISNQNAMLEEQIDQYTRINKSLDEREEREKRLLDLSKQREKLENIKNQRNVRIYKDGEWQWIADPKLVRDETERLENMQEDYYKWEEGIRRQSHVDGLRDQLKALQESQKIQQDHHQSQMDSLRAFVEEEKKKIENADKEKIDSLEGLLDYLEGLEEGSYRDRLKKLYDFIEAYKTKLEEIGIEFVFPELYLPERKINTIEGLYKQVLGRNSDEEGHDYFSNQLSSGNMTMADIEAFMRNSPEFKNKRGYKLGGVNDSPGMAMLHGSKVKPELILNDTSAGKLWNFVDNLVKNPTMPNMAMAGAGGGNSAIYHVNIAKVETPNAQSFIDLVPTLVKQYK